MRTVLSTWQQKVADGVDRLTLAVSPKRAYLRRAYRFAYDALDRSRPVWMIERRSCSHARGG
jgi:hypothetical protein